MLESNHMTINSLILTEVITIRKTTLRFSNHLVTKRSNKTIITSIILNSTVKVFNETFTTSKNYIHITGISIAVKNITNSTIQLIKSKFLSISIIVTFTTNLLHTSSMWNRLTIVFINKSNLTVYSLIIFCKPKTLFIHNTLLKLKLAHFLIHPKISSTTTTSLKLISNNSITNITSNLFTITMELKLRSHLTRSHSISTITL